MKKRLPHLPGFGLVARFAGTWLYRLVQSILRCGGMDMVLADFPKAKSDRPVVGLDLIAKAVLTSRDWLAMLLGNGSLLVEYGLWIWTEKSLEADKGSVSLVNN